MPWIRLISMNSCTSPAVTSQDLRLQKRGKRCVHYIHAYKIRKIFALSNKLVMETEVSLKLMELN
jgi:hypothetical protein